MTTEQKALLEIVKVALSGNCLVSVAVFDADWEKLFDLACKQGVVCVAWHWLETLYKNGVDSCPQEVKLQWYAANGNVKKAGREKASVISEFASLVKPIKLVALKGLDYSRFWSVPEWREFGDLDCVAIEDGLRLFKGLKVQDCANLLDDKAQEVGCKVDYDDYKHSHIYYKNLMVENHHSFTSFAGAKEAREQEYALRELFEQGCNSMEDIGLFSPNVNFTAVFMLVHARNHFFYEGLSLRHILDWYFFLIKEGENVDWKQVEDVLERTKLRAFAVLLTQICKKHFGLRFDGFGAESEFDDELVETFLNDVFAEKYDANDRRWWMMVSRMLHRYGRMWKFRWLMHIPVYKAVWRSVAFSSFLHRKPVL